MKKTMDGQQIESIQPRGTMYHNDCVGVFRNGKYYLLPTATILQMVNDYEFKLEKKVKHIYLIEAIKKVK